MSLTLKQWEEMWKSVKAIERAAMSMASNADKRQRILAETAKMKEMIQQVVGQLE